jgi:hypothetical protein
MECKMFTRRRIALSIFVIVTSACSSSSTQTEGADDTNDAGGSDPFDASASLPATALTGRWRFCGLRRAVASEVRGPGGMVCRIDATSRGLIVTELFPDGGDFEPFVRGSYDPNSRALLGDLYGPHPAEGGVLDTPPDEWIDYFEDAVQLTFNSAGTRAQGTLSVRGRAPGGLSAGREDGDFACPPIPD